MASDEINIKKELNRTFLSIAQYFTARCLEVGEVLQTRIEQLERKIVKLEKKLSKQK